LQVVYFKKWAKYQYLARLLRPVSRQGFNHLNQITYFDGRVLLAGYDLDLFLLRIQADNFTPRQRKQQLAQRAKLGDLSISGIQDHDGWPGSDDLSHRIRLTGIYNFMRYLL
jgi:hypothetical protein